MSAFIINDPDHEPSQLVRHAWQYAEMMEAERKRRIVSDPAHLNKIETDIKQMVDSNSADTVETLHLLGRVMKYMDKEMPPALVGDGMKKVNEEYSNMLWDIEMTLLTLQK